MRAAVVVGLLIFMAVVASPVRAQAGIEVEASAGLAGYVDPDEATEISVIVRSPTLFEGAIELSMGSFSTSVPLEVPADGLKELTIPLPPPRGAPNILVQVVDGDGDSVLDRGLRVPIDSGINEVLTGVLGGDSLAATLQQVRTEPLLLPVTPIDLDGIAIDGRLSALDYVVAAPGEIDRLDQPSRDELGAWVERGGRLIATVSDSQSMGLPVSLAGTFGGAEIGSWGEGELLVVDNPLDIALDQWPRLLRDVPQSLAGLNGIEFQDQGQFNLISAASAGGNAVLPQIPWLAFALAAYTIIVGPVNFFVLRSIRKPELAWFTIPALSLLAVGLFWLNGPRGDRAQVSHASVVVFDLDRPRAQSGLVMITGTEGRHELQAPAGWSLNPVASFGPSNVADTSVGADGASIAFDLESLEAATMVADWTPGAAPLRASVQPDGSNIDVTVSNESDWTFWSWGIVSGFDAAGRSSDLEPQESADTTLRFNGNGDPWEPPMARIALQGNFDFSVRDPWEVVYPLSNHLGSSFRDALSDLYLFGFTDDIELEFVVDGDVITSRGTSLVVVPVDDGVLAGGGVSTAELVYAEGADWFEPNGFSTFIGGADAVYLRFSAPDGVNGGRVTEGFNFGVSNTFAVYDWERGDFVDVDNLGDFAGSGYFTPTGEVLVRMSPGEEFSDVVPDTISVEWEA